MKNISRKFVEAFYLQGFEALAVREIPIFSTCQVDQKRERVSHKVSYFNWESDEKVDN